MLCNHIGGPFQYHVELLSSFFNLRSGTVVVVVVFTLKTVPISTQYFLTSVTPRPSRGTRIESCDFIVLIGDP